MEQHFVKKLMPGIIKRLERCSARAFVGCFRFKCVKLVILLFGIERRISVDNVHPVGRPLPQDVEIIAVVQAIHFGEGLT